MEDEEGRSTDAAVYRIRVADGSAAADLHSALRSSLSCGPHPVPRE